MVGGWGGYMCLDDFIRIIHRHLDAIDYHNVITEFVHGTPLSVLTARPTKPFLFAMGSFCCVGSVCFVNFPTLNRAYWVKFARLER